jgi:hypothetical protein
MQIQIAPQPQYLHIALTAVATVHTGKMFSSRPAAGNRQHESYILIHTVFMLLAYQQRLLNVAQTMADIEFQDVRIFARSKPSHKFIDIFITCHCGGMRYVTDIISNKKQELLLVVTHS